MSRIYIGDKPVKAVMVGGKKYVAKGRTNIPTPVCSMVYLSFTGSDYIDTGIDLSQYEGYTVCIDAKFGDTRAAQNLVDWMTEASPYPVWAIDVNGSRIRMGARSAFSIEELTTTERRRYVVRYDGTTYTLFSIKDANGYDFTSTVAAGTVNHTLLIGAYYNNGTISRYVHAGTIVYDFKVFDKALTDEQCKAYYETGVIS